MARVEIRIAIRSTAVPDVVDRQTLEELLRAVAGRAISLRGERGRRIAILELRLDPRPSSAHAIYALIEESDDAHDA